MRCFLAVDLSDQLEVAMEDIQERLPVGDPVDPETFHLTLAFLGDQDEETLTELHERLSALRVPALETRVRGLGTFGRKTPQVLFAQVERTEALADLQERVKTAVRRAGITLERRRFKPHITLARYRRRVEGRDLERLRLFLQDCADMDFGPLPVRAVTLYSSVLRREGPVHEALESYPLDGRNT